MSAVAVVVGAAACTGAPSGEPDGADHGTTTTSPIVPAPVVLLPEVIEPGDCLRELPVGSIRIDIEVVDCDENGSVVVTVVVDTPSVDGAFPGDDAVWSFADERCAGAAEQGREVDLVDSLPGHIVPDAGMWDAGERRVVCVLDARRSGR